MRKAFIAASVFAALAAGAVQAKPAAQPKPPITFDSVDADKDGSISREEVRYMDDLNSAFGKLDSNADQKLSAAEYAKWARAAKEGEAAQSSPLR